MPNQVASMLDLNDQKRFLDAFLETATESPFTAKQMFFRSLRRRDWTFTMSDDSRAQAAGSKHLRELRQQYESLKLTYELEDADVTVIEYCLKEFVLDIPESYMALINSQAGREVDLKINPCVQFIAHGLHPRTTFEMIELHKRVIELRAALQNLGKMEYSSRALVYSPYMIPQKHLFDTVYSTSFGRTQYTHVAISPQAETMIKRFFDNFTVEAINLYTVIMSKYPGSVDLVNILTAENHTGDERHTHLRLDDALIALPSWYQPFQANTEFQDKLYRRDVDRHTIANFRKYRAELETLMINRQFGVE